MDLPPVPEFLNLVHAALESGRLVELQTICEDRNANELRALIGELRTYDTAFGRRAHYGYPRGDFWESFQRGMERYVRVPYHGVYYSHPLTHLAPVLPTPFVAEAFRALDTYTKDTLDIHFLPADLQPLGSASRGQPLYYHLEGFLGTTRPVLDTLYVWKTTDLRRRAYPPERVEALRVGHFHRNARLAVIVTLTLLLQAGVPLADAVRDACERPAHLDAAELRSLLPGKRRSARKAARAWADTFAARYPDREDIEPARTIIADLQSPRLDRQATARAALAVILALSGALGAPHVLTNDLPETYQVILDLYTDLTDGDR